MPGAVVTRVITGYKTGQKNGIKEREDWTMNRDIFMELMAKREYKAVRSILDVMNTVDIASLLEELDDREMATAFRLIPKEKAADVFSNMNNAMQSHLVQMFTDQELKELLDDLYMDDTVDLLEELPANLVTQILELSLIHISEPTRH